MRGMGLEVTVKTGDLDVIASGSFILKNKDAGTLLHINLNPKYKLNMDLVWNFYKDDSLTDVKTIVGRCDIERIEINVYNAGSMFGIGTLNPVKLVDFNDGTKLYCHYIVNRPTENNPYVFTYSLYLGK